MEMRSRFSLSSSWQTSIELNRLLRVINSSGVILDEPYASERAQVTLTRPTSAAEDDPSCYIHIDSAHLRGYFLAAVELVSSSRTVELYSSPEQDYITTARASLTEKLEDGTKVFSTQFELPADCLSTSLSLKLLSLQGRTEVTVKDINVIVSEDYGGSKPTSTEEYCHQISGEASSASCGGSGLDLQQMMQTIGASQSVPPFLKSLAASLQLLQLQQSTGSRRRTNSSSATNAGGGEGTTSGSSLPMDLTQLMDAFKQIRPPPPPPAAAAASDQLTTEEGGGEEGASRQEESSDYDGNNLNENVSKLIEERLSEMERRLLGYIDSKFADLEKTFLSKVDHLTQRLDSLHQTHDHSSSRNCEGTSHMSSNGDLPSLTLSEDQQLD